MSIGIWAQEAVFYPYLYQVIDIGTGLYLGRAPRTKETLPDFHEWHQVTRHPLVFRRLTGSQRTPGVLGVTLCLSSFPQGESSIYLTSSYLILKFEVKVLYQSIFLSQCN